MKNATMDYLLGVLLTSYRIMYDYVIHESFYIAEDRSLPDRFSKMSHLQACKNANTRFRAAEKEILCRLSEKEGAVKSLLYDLNGKFLIIIDYETYRASHETNDQKSEKVLRGKPHLTKYRRAKANAQEIGDRLRKLGNEARQRSEAS